MGTMQLTEDQFETRAVANAADLCAVQRLRYEVFVNELGACGDAVDHKARRECDRFDASADHLMLLDRTRAPGEQVIGTYRLMRQDHAAQAGQFYSEDEYDITPLRNSGRRLLELGRSCLHRDYRGGPAMLHLWQGLADYVAQHRIELLFGVASFRGNDPAALAGALSHLHHHHRAPATLRPHAIGDGALSMDLMPPCEIDRPRAVVAMPALIKAYLRAGAGVGEGAFVDRSFNCIDVCMVLDAAQMSGKHRAIYARARG